MPARLIVKRWHSHFLERSMKAILTILIVPFLQQSFAQVDMDTSKILTTRIGWQIENNSKDSCLFRKVYKYESGLFKEELQLCDEYSTITISDHEIKRPFYGQEFKPFFEKYFTKGSVATKRYHYDDFGHLDSLILLIKDDKSGERGTVMKTIKRFDSKNRLERLESHEGTFEYEYDTKEKLRKTVLTRRNGARKVDTYENDKLINESLFDTSNRKYLEQKYTYDNPGNLIRADINKYEYWSYEYNKYGLTKEEKWGGPDNNKKLMERIVYAYDNDGKLRMEEWFEQGKLRKLIRYYYE